MDDGAYFGNIFAGSIEIVIDGQTMAKGQVVHPIDCDGLAAIGRNGGTGHGSIESPQDGGGEIAVNLLTKLGQCNPVVLRAGGAGNGLYYAGDGQGIDERLKAYAAKLSQSRFLILREQARGRQCRGGG
jgi:hypothetical protein